MTHKLHNIVSSVVTAVNTPDENRAFTCVTFDNGDDNEIRGSRGVWVSNKGVSVINERGVCKWKRCGYFNGNASLQIPFFSNNFQNHKQFSLSFFYAITGGATYQGLIGNQCDANPPGDCSLSVSSPSPNLLSAGLSSVGGQRSETKYDWVRIDFNSTQSLLQSIK